jgi:hypothetical protein
LRVHDPSVANSNSRNLSAESVLTFPAVCPIGISGMFGFLSGPRCKRGPFSFLNRFLWNERQSLEVLPLTLNRMHARHVALSYTPE